MKKYIGIIAVLLQTGVSAFAAVHPFIGGNFGKSQENSELNASNVGGAQVGLQGKYFGGSLGFYHFTTENKVETFSKGTVSLTPIMANLYGRLPISFKGGREIMTLRLGVGAGQVQATHKLDSTLVNDLARAGFALKEDIKSGLGYQLNSGVDIWLTKNITLGADINYLMFKTEATGEIRSRFFNASFTDEVVLNSLVAMAAVKFHF